MTSIGPEEAQIRRGEGHAAEALRREAGMLQRAQHPGVVGICDLVEIDGEVSLSLDLPEGPLLGDAVLTVGEIAAVFAVLATTVADLHHLGLRIGTLHERSVVISPDGRPVIIDLAGATSTGSILLRAGRSLDEGERADDRMLGQLLDRTLVRCAPAAIALAVEPPRLGRLASTWSTLMRRTRHEGLAHVLAAVAASAAQGELSAQKMAHALVHPDACLPRRPVHVRPPLTEGPPPFAAPRVAEPTSRVLKTAKRDPRSRIAVIALCTVGGLILVIAAVRGPQRARVGAASSVGSTTTSSVSYENAVLETPAGRYAVGRTGDRVAVGRWTCGQAPTLALLRPDRGELWAFQGWPGDAPLVGHLITRIAHARTLSARRGQRCDNAVVTRDDGSTVTLDPSAFP